MTVRVLGTVDIVDADGSALALGPKERALVAALAVRAGEGVSEDSLTEVLWGDGPPPTATKTLRSYISRIRRALGDAGAAVVADGSGYRLDPSLVELDAAVVERLREEAVTAASAGDHQRAGSLCREALARWRGASLGELASEPWATVPAARLDELRLGLLEARVDADLESGRHLSLVGELESLTATYPFRERLWAARMVALYRSGRQADALRVFEDLRRLLADELGLDPSPELRALERRILEHDPTLAGPEPTPPTSPARALPAGVVTFLLTDVAGSTRLWEEHPSAMTAAMARHDEIVTAVVTRARGSALKQRGEGDSTFSVFARTSDAAAAALEIAGALAGTDFGPQIELRVRMAIHVGQSVERDGDYYGPAVNRAARLRAAASPGQILVSQAAAGVLTDDGTGTWDLRDLGETHLKDLARPERVYTLVAPSEQEPAGSAPEPVPASASAVEDLSLPSPLAERGHDAVRTAELTQLSAMWRTIGEGGRRAVFIGGEPGIGKTWLSAAMAKNAHADGATVLLGRCDDDLALPYRAFTEALDPVVHAIGPALATQVQRAGELARLIPDVASIVPGVAEPLRADAEAERWALFEAVDELVASVGVQRPVLLVIDDIHWAATPTLLLLRHILRSERDHRLMVIATYRHTELSRSHPLAAMLADFRREPAVQRLMLDGLDDAGVAAMAEALAGQTLDDDDASALIAAVHRETGGNPFFVEEILRHLAETGALSRDDDGRWRAATAIEEMRLPESIRDVVTRRLSRLSDAANRALTYAAVLGPEFTLQLLEAVPHATIEGTDLLETLEEAQNAGLLIEAPAGFAFAHALIRQALLDELSAPRRMRAHRHVAEAIEALPDHRVHVDLLAHHFAEAALDGQAGKAASYALAAGEASLLTAGHDHAVVVLRRGLEALDLAPEDDPLMRAKLLTALAKAMSGSGDVSRQEMIDVATAAVASALDGGCDETLVHALEVRTDLYRVSTVQPELAPVFPALLARQHAMDPHLRARLLAAYAAWLANEALDEVYDVADASIAITDELGVSPLERALRAKLTASWWRPEPDVIRELGERLAETQDPYAGVFRFESGVYAQGTASLLECDGDEFEAVVAELDELATRTRGWSVRYNALASRITLAMIRGHWSEARQLLDEFAAHGSDDIDALNVWSAQQIILHRDTAGLADLTESIADAVERSPDIIAFRCGLAMAHAEAGQREGAMAIIADIAPRLVGWRRDQTWPIAVWALGAAIVRAQAIDHAATIRDLLAPYSGLLIAPTAATLAPGLADDVLSGLERLLGNNDGAVSHASRAIEQADRLRSAPMRARALFALGRAHWAAGDADLGLATMDDARRLAEELGMRPVADEATSQLASCKDATTTSTPAQ